MSTGAGHALWERSNRLVANDVSDALGPLTSKTASWSRDWPLIAVKLPTATSLVPLLVTSNRFTLVLPGSGLAGS